MENDVKYTCYSFGHTYLRTIQQGIQAAHVQTELALKYWGKDNLRPTKLFLEWGRNHKTMALLDGGNDYRMQYIFDLVQHEQNEQYAWCYFNEPDAANILSNISIVLPSTIYEDGVRLFRRVKKEANFKIFTDSKLKAVSITNEYQKVDEVYTEFEWKLIELINRCPKAI